MLAFEYTGCIVGEKITHGKCRLKSFHMTRRF